MIERDSASGKKLGQRRTTQRDAISRAINDAGQPLTVTEIHERAKASIKDLGIATVYRTVKLLLENESIQIVALPDSETRYEAAELGHHHHFQCRVCNEVFDVETCPIAAPSEVRVPEGFQLEGHEITLYGTCPKCSLRRAP